MIEIAKQASCQKFIYKIHSSRLRRARWNLALPMDEARRNDEVISLADSQILRWIDELNGVEDADRIAKEIKSEIKHVKNTESGIKAKRHIRELYSDLDNIQFKPDYMCLIIDKDKDYYRACKGFQINGIKYRRLLGTNGGIKNSTIVFVSERLHPELNRRIDNGRDLNHKMVTAKLETYRALTCSASIPVSSPNGVLVVNDFEYKGIFDVLYITDENSDEPVIERRPNQEAKVNATDGFGLMCPELAERWSNELNLDYVMSGANTRFSFEKGMVFTFDFVDFANKIAGGNYTVKDAWGNEVDIRDVELILTTSMVKLWDSYSCADAYFRNSRINKYTFGIAKTCPKELENERFLNYQFIQSYDLDDNDIDELISPTVNEIKDVINGDWKKAILFLKGSGLNENNIDHIDNDFAKAIMINHDIINDPFVQSSIYQLIEKKIDEAKAGVIKVHGNFSIASGDPYSLCQSIWGLEVTGLLKPGEIYNKYWIDLGSEKLACYRAPMTCHNNIRLVHLSESDEAKYWYQYITTGTIFNSWDTAAMALNGMDYDGDLVMLTDNRVMVDKLNELPALMCVQKTAVKTIASEEDFIKSNISSFGNDIGQTTNWITSMFEVQSHFAKDTKEYKELAYRIQCGQLFQQNAIDKAKGIVYKPMPKEWHDRHSISKSDLGTEEKMFYRSIVADKKPYFMRYVYPSLMKQYNTYIKNTEKNALREFEMTIDQLKSIPYSELTDRQKEFLMYYDIKMPVGIGDCVMNKICRKIENEFNGYLSTKNRQCDPFDYSIMRSSADYTKYQFDQIKCLYENYNLRIKDYAIFASTEKINDYESQAELDNMSDEFKKECEQICQDDKSLCNIVLDLCYSKSSTKRFAWKICGNTIISNLLEKFNSTISFPAPDDSGDIIYCGNRFSIFSKAV